MHVFVEATYCTGQSSLRTTEHRTVRTPATRSSEQPMRPYLNFLRRNPDRLNQRRQKDSFAGKTENGG